MGRRSTKWFRALAMVPWLPFRLFRNGEAGAWYGPSDMSTMFQDSAGTTPVTAVEQPVGRILDKSGRGNHATQATTAAKPVLSARKNLLTYSEDFTNAVWTKEGLAVAANTADTLDPFGGNTADKLTEDGATSEHRLYQAPTGGIGISLWSIYAKAGSRSWLSIRGNGGIPVANFNLSAGTVGTVGAGGTASILSVGNGWYRCSVLPNTSGGAEYFTVNMGDADTGTGVGYSYAGNGVGTLYVWGAQLENGAASVTSYQRVTTATDYDTVGFPHYLRLDRVDDNITAAAGGGGTTGILICAAIHASGAGNARTIWSDQGTNTGYRLSLNATNQLVLSAGNGTAYTEVVGPTITAGTDCVVTGWHDGANLRVQVNAGAATAAAFGTATAGTAGFTIGKDNGAASGYYGERIYEIVHRQNDASTAQQRTDLITYMAVQAGITL